MSVFIMDGNQRATLAVVRALGRAGIPVTVGESEPASLAGSSRYCVRRVRYPSPLQEPEALQAFLQEETQRGGHQLLLPMTDVTVRLVAPMRETLAPWVRLAMPPEVQVMRIQDKRSVLLAARRIGIDCPETFTLEDDEDIEALARRLVYPVVIKPRFSRYLHEGHWVAGSVQYALDPEDFVIKYRNAHTQIPFPLVQKRVQGEGRGVFLLLWNNELKAAFCHRRLREKPPWGGVSVYCESLPPDEELVEKSLALLREFAWQGVAMVEYKRDRREGRARLMEVNGRFWGSLQLAIDAGMNFPLLLYRLATGTEVPAQWRYKVGVKSRWLLGDLDNLLIQLTHSRAPNGSPACDGSRLGACFDFLKFYERDLHYEVFKLHDPKPGWHELRSYLASTARHFMQPQRKNSED